MEPKKNPKYDVHRKSGMLFSFSLGCSLLIVITAFEWETKIPDKHTHPTRPTKIVDDTYYPSVTTIDPPSASVASKPRRIQTITPNFVPVDDSKNVLDDAPKFEPEQNPESEGNSPAINIDIPIEITQLKRCLNLKTALTDSINNFPKI
jgi:hypothetical protein